MKTASLVVLLALAAPAPAQFYAPDTEFHDIAQRTFPVEAARVLAWLRNQGGAKIVEVKFEVQTTAARETVWSLRWLDAPGKTVREKKVAYSQSLLLEGPEFFRNVFGQIAGDDWKIQSMPPDNAATAFWQGGELAGVSRLEAVTAASKLLAEKPGLEKPADASRLAGILAHGAMPMLGTQLTIDGVLLSRAAVWLCISEARLREKLEAAWGPIAFLAGREKLASSLWQQAPLRAKEKRGGAERFWDLILRQPAVKESFLFAAKRENRQFAMPAMLHHAQGADEWATLMVDVAPDVLGGDVAIRHFEYGPAFPPNDGVAGDHPGKRTAEPAIRAWIRALKDFTPTSLDFVGYREAVAAAEGLEGNDFFARLPRLAAVINIAFEESARGPLTPVAHVGTRDLLGFGWETTGVQIGYHHACLRSTLKDPEGAKRVAQAALSLLKGIDPFFSEPAITPRYPLTDLARLQIVSYAPVDAALMKGLLPAWEKTPDLSMRRVWLRKGGGNEQLEGVVRAGAPRETVRPLVERLLKEGGRFSFGHLLVRDPGWTFPKVLDDLDLRAAIARELPAEQPDLKPNGAKPLAQLVRDAIAGGPREDAPVDIARFNSADEAWAAVEALREFKPDRVDTPDDQARRFREWLGARQTAAEAFEKKYPQDPRRWDARLLAADSAQILARAGERTGKPLERNTLEEVLAAPDATAEAKGEAAFLLMTLEMPNVNPNFPHTLPPFHRALSDYLEKYPHHRRAAQAARLQLQLLEAVETPGSDNLLKKLSSHPNPEIAGQAKALSEQRTKFVEFKKAPIALKFAASDGTEVDLAKLRGKVVLLDFWASWCGPCIAEAPHVVAAFEKFRERGFAVVGISLDHDRGAMNAAVTKLGMAWPHCFDAERGEQQIAKQFGIRSIPAAWLFDKKGLLRQTGLRGAELHTAIERLLAE